MAPGGGVEGVSAAPIPIDSRWVVTWLRDSSLLPPLRSVRAAPGLSTIERRAVMTQLLPETLTEAARAAAWNLPRAATETVSRGTHTDGLDWNGFRDLYYPDSRRHDLQAIVAYGAYRGTPGRTAQREAPRPK